MLYKVKELKGCKLQGLDGEIGNVVEFYFDDKHWAVRYLVAETGTWLDGRRVLISPHALGSVDIIKRHIDIDLTKEQTTTVRLWRATSPCRDSTRSFTMVIMDGLFTGEAHTCGALIRI